MKAEYTCKNCGRTFEERPSRAVRWDEVSTFCSVTCRLEAGERQILALRMSGKPLIDVGETFIVCLVCGKQLRILGDHMRVHGVSTGGLSNQERNLLLGLQTGSRCAPMQTRQMMAARSTIQGNFKNKEWTSKGAKARKQIDYKTVGALRSQLQQPPAVIENMRRQALASHEKACVTQQCALCGNEFSKTKSNPTRYCAEHRSGRVRSEQLKQEVARLIDAGVPSAKITAQLKITERQIKRSFRDSLGTGSGKGEGSIRSRFQKGVSLPKSEAHKKAIREAALKRWAKKKASE